MICGIKRNIESVISILYSSVPLRGMRGEYHMRRNIICWRVFYSGEYSMLADHLISAKVILYGQDIGSHMRRVSSVDRYHMRRIYHVLTK